MTNWDLPDINDKLWRHEILTKGNVSHNEV